ncbi:MAG: hypothetical protein R2849_03440 [Thermomicrobiales bacterium]
MRAYGLSNAHLEEFRSTWDRGICELTVTEPGERQITVLCPTAVPARTRAKSSMSAAESRKGERLGGVVRGKIVLTDAETTTRSHRTDKFRWAHEAGASVVVFLNRESGVLRAGLYAQKPRVATGMPIAVAESGIRITAEKSRLAAAARLLDRGPVSVRIHLENETVRRSYNVVGDIPGGDKAHGIVLFGGHCVTDTTSHRARRTTEQNPGRARKQAGFSRRSPASSIEPSGSSAMDARRSV